MSQTQTAVNDTAVRNGTGAAAEPKQPAASNGRVFVVDPTGVAVVSTPGKNGVKS
jgi:hypothetical protein